MSHILRLGIEHFMTGVQISGDANIRFEKESASIVRVISSSLILAYWPVNGASLESSEEPDVEPVRYTRGQAEWEAIVKGGAMQDTEQESFDRCGYTTPLYQRPGWPRFTNAVIDAMRTKFGKDSDTWLGHLKWSGDHWYFIKDGMYHGVEPDGYIHT